MATIEILLPKMGESVAEATITKFVTQPGERVEADEPMVEIATDKVAMDEVCLTIAHELIHAKQYASGVLEDMNWKGKCYRDTKYYTELPWEEEAFRKEEEVMRKAIEIMRGKI